MYIVPLSGLESLPSIQSADQVAEQIKPSASLPFKDALREAMQEFSDAQKAAELDAYALVTGDSVELHDMAIRSAMQQASLEMTVQLASRAVSAYKEVLQMQI